MMATGTLVVSLIASAAWLWLNWRALQAHGLSFEQKALMAVGWVLIFLGFAFVFTRMGY